MQLPPEIPSEGPWKDTLLAASGVLLAWVARRIWEFARAYWESFYNQQTTRDDQLAEAIEGVQKSVDTLRDDVDHKIDTLRERVREVEQSGVQTDEDIRSETQKLIEDMRKEFRQDLKGVQDRLDRISQQISDQIIGLAQRGGS